jgi:hypothetical protein
MKTDTDTPAPARAAAAHAMAAAEMAFRNTGVTVAPEAKEPAPVHGTSTRLAGRAAADAGTAGGTVGQGCGHKQRQRGRVRGGGWCDRPANTTGGLRAAFHSFNLHYIMLYSRS